MTRLLVVLLAISSLGAYVGSSAAAPVSVARAGAATSSTTTVRFISERKYVVSATIGRRVVRGKGKLPKGLEPGNVSARPASNVLGSRSVEVLVDYGQATSDMSVRGYSLFTLDRGKLRSVTLDGRQLVLATYTEGGDDGGFQCAGGRLLTHWFHHGSEQGEQTAYRLMGKRLREASREPIRRAVASRPESCA